MVAQEKVGKRDTTLENIDLDLAVCTATNGAELVGRALRADQWRVKPALQLGIAS